MAAAVLTVWPLYLVGSVIIFLGFLALSAWVRGVTGKGPDRPSSTLAVCTAAFLIGSALVAIAIGVDQLQTTTVSTRTLLYHVEVRIHGAPPVRLVLPAPAEPSFFGALNVTNGTSSMRLNHRSADTSIELNATTNVTFDIRAQTLVSIFNETLTRVVPVAGPAVQNANATIQMTADGTNTTTVDLVLQIQLIESCQSKAFLLHDTLREGSATYHGSLVFVLC